MDRIREVIKREKRRAVFPMVCADHCARLTNSNFSEVASNGEKLAEVLEYGYNVYQYDMALVFSDPYVEAQALGYPVQLEPYPILLGPKSNYIVDRTGDIIKAAKILKSKLDVPIFVSIKGPFSLAAFLVGIEKFLKMILKKATEAKNSVEQATEFQIGYLERLLSLEVDIFIGDPVASTSVISPEIFSKFAYEPLKILIRKIRPTGLLTGVHICGETQPIVPQLDTIGTDILSIEDITPATETIKMGGVATDTILYGDRGKIAKEVRKALSEPYLILSTSCDVPADTDPENIKAMIRAVHEIRNN